MYTPIVQKFHSPLSPFEVYQRMYASSPVSFFLDSPEQTWVGAYCNTPLQTWGQASGHPLQEACPQEDRPLKAYSYLGADPFLEVVVEGNRIRIRERRGEVPSPLGWRYSNAGRGDRAPTKKLFSVLRKIFSQYCYKGHSPFPFFTGGAVGYWGYETAALFEKVRFHKPANAGIPTLYLGFYRDGIVYDHKRKHYWLVVNLNGARPHQALRQRFERLKDFFTTEPPHNGAAFRFEKFQSEMSRNEFERMVRKAQAYIRAGDIYQANLSQRFTFRYEGSPLKLYAKLREINPSPFSSFLKIRDLCLVSSSPERLIRKRGRFCETRPMAGTRPVRRGGQGPGEMEKELLSNEKERAEHLMLVDLERSDLGRVCDYRSVKVEEMMTTERYSHVIHIVSKITGRLQKDKDAFDLIRAMFPGGTITGCPKIRCMEIIEELEKFRRGVYTGSIGYLDFSGDLDLNIVIRTLVLQKARGWLQVGAGIVHDSDPGREYEETLHKGEALAQALVEAGKPGDGPVRRKSDGSVLWRTGDRPARQRRVRLWRKRTVP